ncbi:F-box/WD repeat-containing protein 4 [Pectinophora gossypiella]|uniref:F-box/WD repeat-containing protein 4 n=1 Tax=Pectinophora gossypiella TaxID=13191 RepID=UPI00214F05C3|nr:F-box/WD repeat-containing protein 4 [Pectinophora gossypiella]
MSNLSILQLPLDILVNIMTNLSFADLRNVMLTCKALRDLILANNSIWRLISRDCRERLILHNSSDNSQTLTLSWYNRCRISHNWCRGIYRSKVVIYHQINYMPWLKFHESQVLFLSVGSNLQCYPNDKKGLPNCKTTLWKLQVPTVKRFDVRTDDISRFVVKNNIIVCGNRDGCVAVYRMENPRRKPYLLHHLIDCHENGQVEVSAVEIVNSTHKPCIVTACDSIATLRFWSITPDINGTNGVTNSRSVCTNEINLGDNIGVRCVALNSTESKLSIGPNGNSKPLLLDINTSKLVLTFESTKNIKQAVRDVRWHNENIITFVTHSGMLQMLDTRTGNLVYEAIDPFQSTLYCVKSDGVNSILVGSSEYSRCVLFDARNPAHHVQMYFTQKKSSPIYSLDFDSTKLIAAADRSIAVLNFNINPYTVETRDYSHAFEFVNR